MWLPGRVKAGGKERDLGFSWEEENSKASSHSGTLSRVSTPVSECEGHWGVSKGRKDVSKKKKKAEREGARSEPRAKAGG